MSLDITVKWDNQIVFDHNITHNLNKMAEQAGIYEALWRPYRLLPDYRPFDSYDDEVEFEKTQTIFVGSLLDKLQAGLKYIVRHEEQLKKLEPENGWGRLTNLYDLVRDYYIVATVYPFGVVEVDR